MAAHRYWRANATANVSGALSAILELEMYDAAFSANKAVGGTAAADSTTAGYTAAQGFDGDTTDESGTNKAWASAGSALPHWLSYDFGSAIEIKAIGLIGRSAQGGNNGEQTPTAFDVQFSDNNSSWTTSWSESGLTQKVGRFTRSIKSGTAIPSGSPHGSHTYWRLAIIDTQGRNAASMGEVEMRATPGGADQCTGGTASAKNIFSGGFVAANAFDNSSTTLWSGTDPSNWLKYAFASPVEVAEVVIKSRHDSNPETSPEALVVQWSDDNTNWTSAWGANSMLSWSLSQTRTLTDPYYSSPAPGITSVTPNHGPVIGGTAVTVLGFNFTGSTSIKFNGTVATSFVVVDDTHITCVTPAGPGAGAIDVEVFNPSGNYTLVGGFTYDIATLTSVTPNNGPIAGGTAVTLVGTLFTGATDVKFDGVSATSIVVVNATHITCVTPSHASGAVNVQVFTPNGNPTLAASYTYVEVQVRVTQAPLLAVYVAEQPNRVTQAPLIVLYQEKQPNRVTQAPTLVMYTPKPVPLPEPVIPEVPLYESWSWLTAMNEARTSQEQRGRLREVPRYKLQLSALILNEADRVRIYNMLMRFQKTVFTYPLFQYNAFLTASAIIGDTKLFCDTSKTDVREGEFIALFDPRLETVVYLTADAIDSDGINLASPLTVVVPASWQVCPALSFRIAPSVGLNMRNISGDLSLTMESTNPRVFQRPGAAPALTTIDGLLIVPERPLTNVPESFNFGAEWSDNGTSVPELIKEWTNPHTSGSRKYKFNRRTLIDYWRAVCDTLKGMQGVALFSTFRNDLPLRDAMTLNAKTFTTNNTNFFVWWLDKNFRYLAITTANGVKYRAVTSVDPHYNSNGDPDFITVTLASSTGNTAGDNAISAISYMNLHRLDTDEVKLTHSELDTVIEFAIKAVNE